MSSGDTCNANNSNTMLQHRVTLIKSWLCSVDKIILSPSHRQKLTEKHRVPRKSPLFRLVQSVPADAIAKMPFSAKFADHTGSLTFGFAARRCLQASSRFRSNFHDKFALVCAKPWSLLFFLSLPSFVI